MVSFSLPRPGRARLALYSVGGRRERVLADGTFRAGIQRIDWDGRGAQGRRLEPGVYFLRLEAAGVTRVERVVVMR